MKRRMSFASGGLLLAAAALAVACKDLVVPKTASRSGAVQRAQVAMNLPRVTSAELHSRNPMDWVGELHVGLLEEVRHEVIRTRNPNVDICGITRRFNASAAKKNPRGLSESTRRAIEEAVMRLPSMCPRWERKSNVHSVSVRKDDLGEAFYTAVAAIGQAGDDASDPDDFATRLSPILESTSSMNELDGGAVAVMIAGAQSSYDYWYDGSVLASYAAPLNDYYQDCLDGNGQGTTFQTDGATYYCDNRQWIESMNRLPRSRSESITFAWYTPTPAPFAPKQGGACLHGLSRFKAIFHGDADGGTAGGIVGAAFGGIVGFGVGAYEGMQIGSESTAIYQAYHYVRCVRGYET